MLCEVGLEEEGGEEVGDGTPVAVVEALGLGEELEEFVVGDLVGGSAVAGSADEFVEGDLEGVGHALGDLEGGEGLGALVLGEVGDVDADAVGECGLLEAAVGAELADVVAEVGHCRFALSDSGLRAAVAV